MSNLKEKLEEIRNELDPNHYVIWEKPQIEIYKRYAEEVIKEASEVASDSLELYPSEYKKLEQSILKLIEEL